MTGLLQKLFIAVDKIKPMIRKRKALEQTISSEKETNLLTKSEVTITKKSQMLLGLLFKPIGRQIPLKILVIKCAKK